MITVLDEWPACIVCGSHFSPVGKEDTCSKECKSLRKRKMISLRGKSKNQVRSMAQSCIVCGFDEVIDVHHEGTSAVILCPNHHALITRGIRTLKEMLESNA